MTALKAGAADYLVKDTLGEFVPLLHVAAEVAIRQALIQKARDDAEDEVRASRDRYAALAAEREVLLREVNHRVGNSLQIIASLLHLQANSSPEEGVKTALTNAMGRVAAVAQVHRRLYTSHDLKSVLLNQYLEALLEDLRRSAEGNRMSRLDLKAEPVEIDPDRAVAIGIIVNELVMNAVKYAYPDGPGPIHVELAIHGGDIELSITDDGVGLNARSIRARREWASGLFLPWRRNSTLKPNAIPPMPARASCCGSAARFYRRKTQVCNRGLSGAFHGKNRTSCASQIIGAAALQLCYKGAWRPATPSLPKSRPSCCCAPMPAAFSRWRKASTIRRCSGSNRRCAA